MDRAGRSAARMRRIRITGFPVCLLVGLAGLARSPVAACARPPDSSDVVFDVATAVACRDVTTGDDDRTHPAHRRYEARLRVSSLRNHAAARDSEYYFVRLRFLDQGPQVVDYQPRTTLATDVVGHVGIQSQNEHTKSLGVSLSGSRDGIVKASGAGDLSSKRNAKVQFEKLPPLELLAAAGTVERSRGVYFKLYASPRTALEGSTELVVVFRVPQCWRVGQVVVECRAYGPGGLLPSASGESRLLGANRFLIALYVEGDSIARSLADQLAAAESELRAVVARHDQAIQRVRFPSVAHRLGALVDAYQPVVPDDWLERWLYQPDDMPSTWDPACLPHPVRRAALRFANARQATGR